MERPLGPVRTLCERTDFDLIHHILFLPLSDEQHWIAAQPDRPKYTDDNDSVFLEDESGRVQLTGAKINSDLFVTGKVHFKKMLRSKHYVRP